MNMEAFIEKYDVPGSIVLLEGKRNVLLEDQSALVALGKMMAERTEHILFRSGNAAGADAFFSEGVASVNPKRLQVIVPYDNHRSTKNYAHDTISLDSMELKDEGEVVYQSKFNKKTAKLIDRYVAGDKDRFAIKAAYIIRDTVKVLGAKGVPAATFGIFYDDLSDPRKGGTGHTMDVCDKNQMPLLDQSVWMDWLI